MSSLLGIFIMSISCINFPSFLEEITSGHKIEFQMPKPLIFAIKASNHWKETSLPKLTVANKKNTQFLSGKMVPPEEESVTPSGEFPRALPGPGESPTVKYTLVASQLMLHGTCSETRPGYLRALSVARNNSLWLLFFSLKKETKRKNSQDVLFCPAHWKWILIPTNDLFNRDSSRWRKKFWGVRRV